MPASGSKQCSVFIAGSYRRRWPGVPAIAATSIIANAYPFLRQTALVPRTNWVLKPPHRQGGHTTAASTRWTNLALVASRQAACSMGARLSQPACNYRAPSGLARLSGPHGAKAANAAHALIATMQRGRRDGRSGRRAAPASIVRHCGDHPAGHRSHGANRPRGLPHQSGERRHASRARRSHRAVPRSLQSAAQRLGSGARGRKAATDRYFGRAYRRDHHCAPDFAAKQPGRHWSRQAGAMHGHGLAIARELMERNGGTLSCETSRKGTTFRLELAAITSFELPKAWLRNCWGSEPVRDFRAKADADGGCRQAQSRRQRRIGAARGGRRRRRHGASIRGRHSAGFQGIHCSRPRTKGRSDRR
jgi:hypothetical protein